MSVDNIKVAIKVRPVLKKEKDQTVCWKISDNAIQLFESQTEPFYFDHIFDPGSSNQDVFKTVVKPIVKSCMEGINGTIFAYGQTSSGKTYTMLGDEENPGVINLAVKEIFDFIENSMDRLYLLRVGYIEIYNEKIYDLLNKDNKDLKIHETTNGDITVNCSEFIVTTELEILNFLQTGNKSRKCGETNMNERSSRSHAIFKLTVESREAKEHETDSFQISSLNLVDLAGSERADQTGATGSRLKEGSHINKSLLSLGCVIKSLSESAESYSYINYRNSKLTRILQASLGGNALTAIVCNIKLTTIEETNSTLNFAMRAKTIKNKPKVNEVISDAAMMKILEKKVSKLQAELELERKTNSKLKICELEKLIKYETHKIVNAQCLKTEKFDRNRRRTWCFSFGNNSSTNSEKQLTCAKRSLKCEPKSSIKNLPHLTPLITFRNETNNYCDENEDDDLFHESPVFADSILLETTHDNINLFQTPVVSNKTKNREKLDTSKSPCLKDKYDLLERELKELETFTRLEKKLDVNHDIESSLMSNLEACRIELINKNEEIQKLHEIKLETDIIQENLNSEIEKLTEKLTNSNDSISNLEKKLLEKEKQMELERRDKVISDFELEQLKHKYKIREEELLEVIEEKNEKIKKFEMQNINNANLLTNNYVKLNGNLCNLCSNSLEDTPREEKREKHLKNDFIKIMENNNNLLQGQYEKLISKYFLIEEIFNKLNNDFVKTSLDLENKEVQFNNMCKDYENLKIDFKIQVENRNSLKNNIQFLNDENQNLKLLLAQNNVLISSVEEECTSLKKLVSTLIENMNKLEEEQNIVFKENIYEDVRKLRNENNSALKKIYNLEQTLEYKNRELMEFKNLMENITLYLPTLKSSLIEIKTTIKSEKLSNEKLISAIKGFVYSCTSNKLLVTETNINISGSSFIQNKIYCNDNKKSYENYSEFSNTICESLQVQNSKELVKLKDKIIEIQKENDHLKLFKTNIKLELESLRLENENLSEKIMENVTSLDILTDENIEIKKLNESFEKEINNLKVNHDLKTNENLNLKILIENVQKELEQNTLTIKILTEENELKTKKYEDMIENYTSTIKILTEENELKTKKYEDMIENYTSTIKILTEETELKTKKYQEMLGNYNNSKIESDLSRKEIENLKTINVNLTKDLDDLKTKNQDLQSEMEDYTQKNKDMRELKESFEAKTQDILTLEEKIRNYSIKCDKLEDSQISLNTDNQKLLNKCNDLEKENKTLASELEISMKSCEEVKECKKQLNLKLNETFNEIDYLLNLNKSLKDSTNTGIEQLTSKTNELNNKIQEITIENVKKLEAVEKDKKHFLDNLHETFEKERQQYKKEIENYQKIIKNLEKNEIIINNNDIHKMKETIDILNNKISDLRLENEVISKELSQIKTDYNKVQIRANEIDKINVENKSLKLQITEIQNSLDISRKTLETNKDTYLKLKEKLKKNIEELTNEINNLKIKNQALTDEVEVKQHKQSENWRKLRRQSCHDETRSFFSEPFQDASIMTDPTDQNCNCISFAEKISDLKKSVLIKDSQITALNLKINNNAIKDEVLNLKKELLEQEYEKNKLNHEITKLKEKISQQSAMFSEHLRQAISDEKSERKKVNQSSAELKEQLAEQRKIYDEKLRNLNIEKERLLQAISDEKSERKKVNQSSAELKEQLAEQRKIYDEKLRNLNIEKERLLQAISDEKSERKKVNQSSVELKEQLAEQRKIYDEKLRNLNIEKERLLQDIATLGQNNMLQSQMKEQLAEQGKIYDEKLRNFIIEKERLLQDIVTLKQNNMLQSQMIEQLAEQKKIYDEKLKNFIIENEKLLQDIAILRQNNMLQSQMKEQLAEQGKIFYDEKLRNFIIEKERLLQDIATLKQNNMLQSQMIEQLAGQNKIYDEKLRNFIIEKEKLLQEIATLKQNMLQSQNLQETNTAHEETDMEHLIKVNQDLKVLCRYRNTKNKALQEEIDNLRKLNS